MPRGKSPVLTREQQEQAVLAAARKTQNDNRLRTYEPPKDKQDLHKKLPEYFQHIRTHGNETLQHYGRPPKFTPEEFEFQLSELFQFCAERQIPVSISLICSWFGVYRDILNVWTKDESHPLYDIIKRTKEDVESMRVLNAETGAINPVFAMFVLKTQHGYVEEQHINLKAQAMQNAPEQLSERDVAETVKLLEAAKKRKP